MIPLLYWLTQNLSDVPPNTDWLGDNERSVLAGFRFEKRRNDWLLGRWTAKLAICACQAREHSAMSVLEIRAADDGAPEAFWNGERAGVALSISHCNARGFCSVGPPDIAIGCDMEAIEVRDNRLIEDYFTAEEIALCNNDPVRKALVTNFVWSAKESILKALREGLRRDTRSVLVHPDLQGTEGSWNTWTGRCLESSRIFHGWWRSHNGFIYTLASDRLLEPSSL